MKMHPTTDLQRMRQDEWISHLLGGDVVQIRGALRKKHGEGSADGRCAMGAALDVCDVTEATLAAGGTYEACCIVSQQLGVSVGLAREIVYKNDSQRWTFEQIALWFKELRDECDGDLSSWALPEAETVQRRAAEKAKKLDWYFGPVDGLQRLFASVLPRNAFRVIST